MSLTPRSWSRTKLFASASLTLLLPSSIRASSVNHFTPSAINLALINETLVDISALGINDQWEALNGTAELRVERDAPAAKKASGVNDVDVSPCSYTLTMTFQHDFDDMPEGDFDYLGVCDPSNMTDPDVDFLHTGQPVYLFQLNETIQEATGFDHVSVVYRPCGLRPLTIPRYDVVFYTVPMAYRALMDCQLNAKSDALPRKCHRYQNNGRGNAHFVAPVLSGNSAFLANRPIDLVAHDGSVDTPAYPYEGLISSDEAHLDLNITESQLNLTKVPAIETSSYDGHFVGYRMLLSTPGVIGSENKSTLFRGNEFYVYPTLPSLPSSYNVGYRFPTRTTSIHLRGRSGTCVGLAVEVDDEDDAGNSTKTNSTETDSV